MYLTCTRPPLRRQDTKNKIIKSAGKWQYPFCTNWSVAFLKTGSPQSPCPRQQPPEKVKKERQLPFLISKSYEFLEWKFFSLFVCLFGHQSALTFFSPHLLRAGTVGGGEHAYACVRLYTHTHTHTHTIPLEFFNLTRLREHKSTKLG